jgi:hypothetical protein
MQDFVWSYLKGFAPVLGTSTREDRQAIWRLLAGIADENYRTPSARLRWLRYFLVPRATRLLNIGSDTVVNVREQRWVTFQKLVNCGLHASLPTHTYGVVPSDSAFHLLYFSHVASDGSFLRSEEELLTLCRFPLACWDPPRSSLLACLDGMIKAVEIW